MDLVRSSSLGRLQSPLLGYQQSSSIVSGYQTQISSSDTSQQKQPGLCQISRSQQEQPEPSRTLEVLCHASLNKVKPQDEGSIARLAVQVPHHCWVLLYLCHASLNKVKQGSIARLAVKVPHHCLLGPAYTLSKHHVSS